MRNLLQTAVIMVMLFALAACGDSKSSSPQNNYPGWIDIYTPVSYGTYTTTYFAEFVGGRIDVDGNFTAVTWRNAATGASGPVNLGSPTYLCFWVFPFPIQQCKWVQDWGGYVLLEFGSNMITIEAYNAGGGIGAQASINLVRLPAPPTGLSAEAVNGQITLRWDAVPEATSYNLYWSTTSYVTKLTGSKIEGVSSPFIHTMAGYGPIYCRVTTLSGSHESAESAVVGWETLEPNIVVNGNVHSVFLGKIRKGGALAWPVTVQNKGIFDLTIGTIMVDNVASPIAISADGCSNQSIASQGTCTITIGFNPISIGRYTNVIQVPSNDPGTPLVSLEVSGRSGLIDLARTGQSRSFSLYDDGYAQQGAAWPSPRFVNNGDGTVTDNLTGLMWAENGNIMPTRDSNWDHDNISNDGMVSWQHALDYVAKLNAENYLDHADWRLPNRKELRSLVNYGAFSVYCKVVGGDRLCTSNAEWLNNVGFTNVQNSEYWSSTTIGNIESSSSGPPTANANAIIMFDGFMTFMPKVGYSGFVWPVRDGLASAPAGLARTGQTVCFDEAGLVVNCAGTGQDGELQKGMAWPEPRFSFNPSFPISINSPITDNLTGLIWNSSEAPYIDWSSGCSRLNSTWQAALDFIKCLNTNSSTNWRLPNVNELESLFHAGYASEDCLGSPCLHNGAWLNTHGFVNLFAMSYWSSTGPIQDNSSVVMTPWNVDLGYYGSISYEKSDPAWVGRPFLLVSDGD